MTIWCAISNGPAVWLRRDSSRWLSLPWSCWSILAWMSWIWDAILPKRRVIGTNWNLPRSQGAYPSWFKPEKQPDGSWHAFGPSGRCVGRMPVGGNLLRSDDFPHIDGYPADYRNLGDDMALSVGRSRHYALGRQRRPGFLAAPAPHGSGGPGKERQGVDHRCGLQPLRVGMLPAADGQLPDGSLPAAG